MSIFRRFRVPANSGFLQTVQNVIFSMLTAPRHRMWRYPGMTLRNVTQSVVDAASGGKSIEIVATWPRACLFFIQIGERKVAALLFKESNRIEVLQPGAVPRELFFGTIFDGFVEMDGGDVTFHVFDVVRFKGRWIPSRVPFEERRADALGLARPPGHVFGISIPALRDGLVNLSGTDRVAVVVTREPQRAYITSVVMVIEGAPPQDEDAAASMPEDDDRFSAY